MLATCIIRHVFFIFIIIIPFSSKLSQQIAQQLDREPSCLTTAKSYKGSSLVRSHVAVFGKKKKKVRTNSLKVKRLFRCTRFPASSGITVVSITNHVPEIKIRVKTHDFIPFFVTSLSHVSRSPNGITKKKRMRGGKKHKAKLCVSVSPIACELRDPSSGVHGGLQSLPS